MTESDRTTMDTNQLATLIKQKYEVLTQLRQLADRQTEIIATSDMTRLLALLATKQGLLQQMQRIETQIDPFREQDPESRLWPSNECRMQTRAAAERCEALLAEIMSREKQCEGDLIVRRDKIAERLQGMHNGTHAASAYAESMTTRNQLDLSSEI